MLRINCIRVFYGTLVGLLLLFGGVRLAYGQAGGGPPDNPCAYPADAPKMEYTDIGSGGWAYMPSPGGTGTAPMVRFNTKGVATFWYCPDAQPATKYRLMTGAATWARLATGSLTPDTPMADPSLSVVWCPFVEEARRAAPVVSVPGTWKVTQSTAFNVNSTYTGLTSVAGTVAVGTACDCAKPAKIGAATYCTFTGAVRPTVVAQCKQ